MSAWFGLDRELVERLVFGVSGQRPVGELSASTSEATGEADIVRAAFARSAWTMIAEPGDGVAGLVVDALGPAEALAAVLDRVGPTELQRRVLASGWEGDPGSGVAAASLDEPPATTPGSRVLGNALARWTPRLVAAEVVEACETAIRVGARLVLPGSAGWHAGLDSLGMHRPHALWRRGSSEAAAGERTYW